MLFLLAVLVFSRSRIRSRLPMPQVNTSEGRVVRAFHRFTLVDQSGGWGVRACVAVGLLLPGGASGQQTT